MAHFVVERIWNELSPEEMEKTVVRLIDLTQEEFEDIEWDHSHPTVDTEGGLMTYCIYEGPSPELIKAHGELAGEHAIDATYEIITSIGPEDLR